MNEEDLFDFDSYSEQLEAVKRGETIKPILEKKDIFNLDEPLPIAVIPTPVQEQTYFDKYFKDLKVGDSGKINWKNSNGFYGIKSALSTNVINNTYDFYISNIKISYDREWIEMYCIRPNNEYYLLKFHKEYGHLKDKTNNSNYEVINSFEIIENHISKEKFEEFNDTLENIRIDNYIKTINQRLTNNYQTVLRKYEESKLSETGKKLITEAANLVFGDDWDLVLNINSNKYRRDVDRNIHVLTLRFPEINIKNSQGLKRKIVDFYLNIYFDTSFKVYSRIMGKRANVLFEEVQKDYAHSHCDGGIMDWGKMCLGTETPLVNQVLKMNNPEHITLENFINLFILLKAYVEWESLEGVPHRKMGNIVPINSEVIINHGRSIDRLKELKNLVLQRLNNKSDLSNFIKVSNVNKNCKVLFDYDVIDNIMNRELNSSYLSDSEYCFKNQNNDYFKFNTNLQDLSNNIRRSQESITANNRDYNHIYFKGETIKTKIIDQVGESSTNTKCVNPFIVKDIVKELEKEINEYYLKQNINEFSNVQQEA